MGQGETTTMWYAERLLRLGLVALIAVAGCRHAAGPLPDSRLVESRAFTTTGDSALAEKWWTAFADDQLNQDADLVQTLAPHDYSANC